MDLLIQSTVGDVIHFEFDCFFLVTPHFGLSSTAVVDRDSSLIRVSFSGFLVYVAVYAKITNSLVQNL